MAGIHATAIVEDGATVDPSSTIGPYCVIGPKVTIGKDVTLKSHISVDGITQVGEGTTIFPFASIGHAPQDLKFGGEESELVIGKHNTIREHVTMNPGTQGGGLVTRVGDNCLFMVGSHVAHDCQVGNHVILANNATLAGHVVVEDGVIIGGLAAIHQFVRIGKFSMIGGMSGVEKDVIPYGTVKGERAHLDGLNLVGLKRRNVPREDIHALRHAFKALFHSSEGTLSARAEAMKNGENISAGVADLLAFILQDSSRSFCTPTRQDAA